MQFSKGLFLKNCFKKIKKNCRKKKRRQNEKNREKERIFVRAGGSKEKKESDINVV